MLKKSHHRNYWDTAGTNSTLQLLVTVNILLQVIPREFKCHNAKETTSFSCSSCY